MADNIVSTTIVSEGGYDSSQNHLNLDTNFPGMATDLLNYEVGLNGGYRRINGFEPFDESNPIVTTITTPAEGKVLGAHIFNTSAGDFIMCARKIVGADTYAFYKYTPGGGFDATGSPTMQMTDGGYSVNKVRAAQVNFGNVDYIIFVDGVNNPQVYNGTTWYELTAAAAGGIATPGGNQLLERPAVVDVYKNHVFLGMDSDYPGVVCHSAPEDILTWTSAAGGGQIVAGFAVTQIKPFRDNLYIFGRNTIKNVTVAGTDFVLNDVTSNIGTLATDSVVEINGDLMFIGPDGIRPISGTDKIGDIQLATVSKQIQKYIQELTTQYDLSLVDSVVIRGKSQFRMFFHAPSEAASFGVGIIGGLRFPDQTSYEFSRLKGFTTSCATSGYVNDLEVVIHGDYDGYLMRQESGFSFNGNSITSIYSTPFLTFGDAKIKKKLRSISTYYRLEGSLSINLRAKFDWDNEFVRNPSSYTQYTVTNTVDYGDGSIYGDGSVYGTVLLNPLIESAIEGSCESVEFTYTTSNTDRPHSILGFIVEYTVQARR